MAGSAATRSGPGRVLVAVYALFAVAASARAGYQIGTRFDEAPVAYALSALAAAIYIAATAALAHGGRTSRLVAYTGCTVELLGVLAVGAASYALPEHFPDATVWSHFGSGYLFIPLVLPILGLWWLRHTARGYDAGHDAATHSTAPRRRS